MSVSIEDLRKDVRMRAKSDPMMSNAWLLVYLPIITVIVGIASMFVWIMASASGAIWNPSYTSSSPDFFLFPLITSIILVLLLTLISYVVSIILRFKLVNRRNTHFRRQSFFYDDLVKAVRTIALKKSVDVEVALSSCERTVWETRAEETEKSAGLWAILTVVPLIGSIAEWYVNYFLMKDFYNHEKREDGFWDNVTRVLNKCDVSVSLSRRDEAVPDRSFVLYFILAIITLGLFGIYWLFVLLKDPNGHFKYHVQVEDRLLNALDASVST